MTNCLKCDKILGKRQKYYCSNECKLTHREGIQNRIRVKPKQSCEKLAKCKIDGKYFRDLSNYSGALSKHLVKLGVVDSKNVLDYYELVDNHLNVLKKWECKYCNWKTVDIKNKSGCITNHVKNHGIDIQDHIDKYPEDRNLWIYSPNKEVKDYILSKDQNSFIECKECGEKFKRLTKTHLDFHNLTSEEYRIKYNVDILTSENTLQKFRDSYKQHSSEINKIKKVSKIESELGDWLKTLGACVEYSNREIIAPYELDLYLKDYNLAIEIHGLYWHSENHGNKHKTYHLSKLEMCEKAGISLIQIFDDEWKDKQNVIKNKLLSKLKKSKEKIYARNCEIEEVLDNKVKSEFLKNNHVQSEDRSSIAFGLYYEKELVSLMTFGPLRKALGQNKKDGHYELLRYCTSKCVIGGASKLFKKFLQFFDPECVVSYADRRYSSSIKSILYDNLGFKFDSFTVPNYWYTKDFRKKLHRFNFTKSRLIKKFNADASKSETEIMRDFGYDRIWDCGNLKYVYSKAKI